MDINPTTEESVDEYLEYLKKAWMPEKLNILRQKLYQKAKSEPKYRFYTLYSHVSRKDVLKEAWRIVKRNKGAEGIDGVSIEDVEKRGVTEFLEELERDLKKYEYKPLAVRRVYIPKAQGGERPLGIPTVRDRVVQAAVRLIIEPIFEATFKDCSYGFRPRRSQHDALNEVTKQLKAGYREVYDIDIKGYFDNIPHDKLIKSLQVKIVDRSIIRLIIMWLKSPIVERGKNGKTTYTKPKSGTPQGGVISPLLANIYLHWMDKLFYSYKGAGNWANAKMVRYADDIVIMARHVGDRIKGFVRSVLENRLDLTLNPSKTKVVNLNNEGASINFLGFTFRMDRDLKGRGWKYLNIEPSKQSLKRERERLRDMTDSHQCHKPIIELIKAINKHLASWKPYYTYGYPRKAFRAINHYVEDRLVVHLRRRSQRPFRPPPEVSYYECIQRLGFVGI